MEPTSGPGPLVTIVVATYGRDEVLTRALESARRQSEERWTALVVGDGCPRTTADAVAQIADQRIRYVNLPHRQGEQSRPNSVGIALASTPLIAFLNQDDLWLSDHLERAHGALANGTDFYAGSAAFAHQAFALGTDPPRPVFSERTPPLRELTDAYWSAPFVFEPVSSFVMTTDLAHRAGPWRPALETWRSPLVDWVLRLARTRPKFVSDPVITTLKVNTHHDAGSFEYSRGAQDHDALLATMAQLGNDGMRRLIAADLSVARPRGLTVRDPSHPFGGGSMLASEFRLHEPASIDRFLSTGTDEFDEIASELGMVQGKVLSDALRRRTGERLPEPTPLDQLIESARSQLTP